MRGREYPDTPMVGVGVIVFDNDSRILLIQRGNEPSKGLWALPGGLVELGEETKAAAKREVAEECSIEVEIGDVIVVKPGQKIPASGSHSVSAAGGNAWSSGRGRR